MKKASLLMMRVYKPITAGTKKPKRNEPCPCGSGKKYKNCCGTKRSEKRVCWPNNETQKPSLRLTKNLLGISSEHYLKYDKENPFIFHLCNVGLFRYIAAGVMVLMIAMGIMNGTQKEFTKKLFVMNYPLTVLPLGDRLGQ